SRCMGICFIGMAEHQAGAEQQPDRLLQAECDRPQPVLLSYHPPTVGTVEGDLELNLQRADVPLDGSLAHTKSISDLAGRQPGRRSLKHAKEMDQPNDPVALFEAVFRNQGAEIIPPDSVAATATGSCRLYPADC